MYDVFGDEPHSWGNRTYDEVRETAERDGSVLVLPVGSIEQHGHHLPVGTDTILVAEVANLAAERVAGSVPVLVAPPAWAGHSPHHMPFGGTLTLSDDTFREVLVETADSALENGFDAVLLLNGHGGNASLISTTTSAVGTDHPDVDVLGLTYFTLAESFIGDIRESEPGGMAHGGEFETSLMLYLRPELVREDELEGTYMDEPYEHGGADLLEGGPLSVYRTFDEYTESGAIGDPALASAEKGAEIYERLGDELEGILTEIHEQNS
jgi:creatinine amidohydrolase